MRRPVLLFTLLIALAALSRVNAQQLADEQTRQQALEFYRTGQQFMAHEQFEKAADSFKAAISKDPLLVLAHYQLGQAYMPLKRYASAIQAYGGAIEAMKALHQLEQANRFEADKRREETIRELRTELSSLGPKIDTLKRAVLEQRMSELERDRAAMGDRFQVPGFILLAMGSAHFRNGDTDAAAAEWRAAVQADSKLGEAHNNLAVLYMLNGSKAEAENEVKLAEKAGFTVNPQLKTDIKKLDK